ncbi:CapA family protein [Phormidium tenue FACHB-886]|nr:CapA family protein [Phormidium tenue FACHB-886]
MANLDSAWQSSVVQLAQQGNLKAITFWLNRYLVPQGMCAQVVLQQPGLLLIRVVCHRLPDGDRLVHFIRQRFFELNSELIQGVRITAQMLGSADLLWEQVVPVRFAAAQTITPSPAEAPHPANQPTVSNPATQTATNPTAATHNPTAAEQIQFIERPIPRSQPATARSRKKKPRYNLRAGSPIAKLRVQVYRWSDTALDQLVERKADTIRAARRSRRWFKSRPLEVRALLLGGSVATAIAAVCGIQVLSQSLGYLSASGNGGLWGATLTAENPTPTMEQSGTVQAALAQVPVIRQAVANPTDPAVTLIFGSNGAIGSAQGIPAYQQADLLITNLDNALAEALPTTASASASALAAPPAIKFTSTKMGSHSPEPAPSDLSPTAVTDSASMLVSSAGFLSTPPELAAEEAEPTTPPESRKATLEELLTNGVDVVNVAADSVMMSGDLGQTLNTLRQKAIYPIGAGQDQQAARHPQIFEVKGQKIALLGYSDSDTFSAGANTAGMNTSLNSQVEADVKAIRDQVDWIIVSYHWNKALRAYPEESQMTLGRAAIDHGADLVVGYAPQITQGAEIYQGRAIVYSLGDALEDTSSEGTADTAALQVTLHNKQMQLEFLPVQIQQNQPTLAAGEAASQIMTYLHQASSLFDHPFRSPLALDAHLRLSLPAAPDSQLPTEPFLSAPSPEEL